MADSVNVNKKREERLRKKREAARLARKKVKEDQLLYQIYCEKERQRNRRRKRERKIKSARELTKEELELRRAKQREAQRQFRRKKKAALMSNSSQGDTAGEFTRVEIKEEVDLDYPESTDFENYDSCVSIASRSNDVCGDLQQTNSSETQNLLYDTEAPDNTFDEAFSSSLIAQDYDQQAVEEEVLNQDEVPSFTSTPNIDINLVDRIVDRVTSRLEVYFREFARMSECLSDMERNNERRHQENTTIRLNELELQKRLVDIKEREFEMKKTKIADFCENVELEASGEL